MIFQMLIALWCHMSKEMFFQPRVETSNEFLLQDVPAPDTQSGTVSRKLWNKLVQICPDLDIESVNRQNQSFWDLIELHAEDNPEIIGIASDILAEAMLSNSENKLKP